MNASLISNPRYIGANYVPLTNLSNAVVDGQWTCMFYTTFLCLKFTKNDSFFSFLSRYSWNKCKQLFEI